MSSRSPGRAPTRSPRRFSLALSAALALLAAALLTLAAAPASAVIVKLHHGRKAVSYQPLRGASGVKPFDLLFSNLDYNGGPVMAANTNYAVYWRPSGAPAYPAEYQSGVNQYLSDLAHDSGGHENTDSVSTQYNDAAGDFARYESHFGGALIDTDPYPANGCKQASICLTDAQLTAELSKFVKAQGLPTDLAHEYFLLPPKGVEDCFEASGLECSAGSKRPVYCAYHGNVSLGAGAELIYSNDPYDTGIAGCDDGNHPNGSTSDGVLEGGLTHEHNESITDPEPNNAWTDFASGATTGYEIGDKCDGTMGSALGTAPNGAQYNQLINGHLYWYQEEWSNQSHSCLQRFSFAGAEPTATFTSTPAGSNEAKFDASGSTAPGGVSRYSWQWGDGSEPQETSTATITHKFPTKGPFVVALTVFAADGTSLGTARTIESGSVVRAPTVLTEAASAVAQTGASLHGTVNPNGTTITECTLEYGTTASYGSSAACVPSPGSGSSPVAVSASVTGLAPNTTYHFRISAASAGGTRTGSDLTFATLLPNPPTFATSFGPPNNIEGSFREPDAVALDPSGNIWVADSGHNRVMEFNKERKFVRQFGSEGSGQGQFRGIQGIAANSAGDVYVSDAKNDRVQEFSPTGEFLRQFGSPGSGNGQFLSPSGIAVDSSGNVWVLDTFNYRVQEFSASGAFLSKFGSQGTENGQLGWASGLAFSGGNLYVADSARVEEFSTAGTYLGQFGSSGTGNGQFHGLGEIASDPTTGNLYVSDIGNNRVQEFSSSGAFIAAFGAGGSGGGQLSGPRGVAVSSSGTLYVADTANNRVQEWLAAKVAGEPPTFATSFTPENIEGSFREPDAVALDPSGNIWVADSGHNRVMEFNKERKFVRQFGSEGSGQGQFRGIQGIAPNSAGDLYVSDAKNDRVQEFSPTGEFLRQFGSPGSGNGQFLSPSGIAVDSSGNVWALDTFNYRVQEFSESGVFLKQFGSRGAGNGQLGWASGLAFAGGNLYVADSARVEEFSTAGTYLGQFGSSGTGNSQFRGLGGIASDPTTGNLYVSDIGNNRVQEFSSSGASIGFIAAFGSGGSGNGQFSGPRGVAVSSSGTLYVADTANNRVQEWVGTP